MSLKYTKLNQGEKLVEKNPITCQMKPYDNDKISPYSENYSAPVSNWNTIPGHRMVTMFITDKRIILEDNSGESSHTFYSFPYTAIAEITGRNGGLPIIGQIGNLEFTLFDSTHFECTDVNAGGYLSRTINRVCTKTKDLEKVKKFEKLLDFESAVKIYEKYEMDDDVIRVRNLMTEQKATKVEQTVVQGDQITKTEIKDSVVSKSNVGGGGSSKAEGLREAKALLDEGVIDDDEFKQMKKEILGK